jgi:predicted nucleotide-binding protein
LKDGSVETEWLVSYREYEIDVLNGLDDEGTLWREYWIKARMADYSKFVKCGFFEIARTGPDGPEIYVLDDALIIQTVENNFDPVSSNSEQQAAEMPKDQRVVFVVHGRNMKAKDALYTFLRSIDLKPQEWSGVIASSGKGSPYPGDVLDNALRKAQAIIVLFTPDDQVKLHPEFQKPDDSPDEAKLSMQPRPNVLFEAGMALGHSEERTIIVQLGKTKSFSDVLGRHTVRLSNGAEARKELAERLRTAGCSVDLSGIDWLSAGDFDSTIAGIGTEDAKGIRWQNTGNLWWLCNDMIEAERRIKSNTSHTDRVDGLRRVYHHARELNLSEEILAPLRKLKEQAINSSNELYWTTPTREKYTQELRDIFNKVGKAATSNQKDFKPDPD